MVKIKATKRLEYLRATIEEGMVFDAIITKRYGKNVYVVDYKDHERNIPFDSAEVIDEPKTDRPESDHYHTGSVDVWQFADENLSVDEVTGFHRINILKYVTRYGKKKGYNRTDLEKAKVMIDKLLELHDKHRK
ncbi:MAG: DUF3310 domain-containing protein [Psychrobacillus sp.]